MECSSPAKNCPFPQGDLDFHLVHAPNGISIGSAVFAGLTIVTDRPIDRPADQANLSVTIGRSATMRPKNKEKNAEQKTDIAQTITVWLGLWRQF